MSSGRAAAFILLLVAPVGIALAQRPTTSGLPTPEGEKVCSIMGRVLYADQLRPAVGVLVKLLQRGLPREQLFTGSEGRFEFRIVPLGQYELEASAEGYRPARVDVDLYFLCRHKSTTIMLERERVGVAQQPPGLSLSARELQIPESARKAFEKGLQEFEERNQPERSLSHFQKAIELYPDFDMAYIQLAMAHVALQQNAEAQRVLEDATSVNGENARAFLLLGMVHEKQGHVNETVQALKTAVRLDENDWLTHFELARALLATGSTQDAHTHALRAHELNPQTPNVHLLLHDVCMQLQDYEAALAEVDEFLELFPDNPLVPQLRQHGEELRKALRAGSR